MIAQILSEEAGRLWKQEKGLFGVLVCAIARIHDYSMVKNTKNTAFIIVTGPCYPFSSLHVKLNMEIEGTCVAE